MIEIIVAASLPYQQEYIFSDSTAENSPTTTKKIAGAALVHILNGCCDWDSRKAKNKGRKTKRLAGSMDRLLWAKAREDQLPASSFLWPRCAHMSDDQTLPTPPDPSYRPIASTY